MKKLLSIFLTVLALVCLLSVTANAEEILTLSDDLQTLTLGDRTYSRADLSDINLYYTDHTYQLQMSDDLRSQLKSAVVYSNHNQWVMSVELYYLDGSRLDICFAYDEVKQELLRLCQDDELVCSIDFWWTNAYNDASAPISEFKGTPTTLKRDDLMFTSTYEVIYRYQELDTFVYRGFIFEYRDTYYYVDYTENNVPSPIDFYLSDGPEYLDAYQITNTELVEEISEALASEYSGETEIGQVLSAIFLCFVFAVIPTGILIMAAIFALRGKGYYRITWGVTAGVCIAELSVFLIIVSQILRA